jgi:uncharacterized DUF497 family protein
MNKLQFQWDKNKAVENLKKHGVSFREAETVFYDENAVEFYDDKHSEWVSANFTTASHLPLF